MTPSLDSVLSPQNLWLVLAVLGVVLVLRYLVGFGDGERAAATNMPQLKGWQMSLARKWYNDRYGFMIDGFQKTRSSMFWFKIAGHTVVCTSGHEARKMFFGNRDLDFNGGYAVFLGGQPRMKDLHVEADPSFEGTNWLSKRFNVLLRKERVNATVPQLLHDLDRRLDALPAHGRMNPFLDMNNIIFQLTMRAVGCDEMADDPKLVDHMSRLFALAERGSSAEALLFPWLPSPSIIYRYYSGIKLYLIVSKVIKARNEKPDEKHHDALSTLLEMGDNAQSVLIFIIGALFAGVTNSSNMLCWLLIYLGTNPAWREKAKAEVASFIATYAADSKESLGARLAEAPVSAWDNELPVLEACLRETIRIILAVGVTLRQNKGSDIVCDGMTIPGGAYMAYLVGDAHYDDEVYKDALKFDPGRWSEYGSEEKGDKNFPYPELSWGAGCHPCLGMRFAKLELKMAAALFLAQFNYEVLDTATKLPIAAVGRELRPDSTAIYATPPQGGGVLFEYTRV